LVGKTDILLLIGALSLGSSAWNWLTPQADLMATDTYNKVFTMHGVIMVFFFLVPSVPLRWAIFSSRLCLGPKTWRCPRSTC